jgi:sulfonate transport system substrate-binding protein
LASRTFAEANPDIVRGLIAEIATVTKWKATHQAELAQVLADASGVDLAVEKTVAARGSYDVGYVTPHVIEQQQAIADTFASLGLLPHKIVVQADVWTPHSRVAADAVPR